MLQMDLSSLINKSQCECLNESDDHTLKNVFQKGKSLYLESDCDEQVNGLKNVYDKFQYLSESVRDCYWMITSLCQKFIVFNYTFDMCISIT